MQYRQFCHAKWSGAMPTLAVGMLATRENYAMPTASVGMAPFPSTFRNRNYYRVNSLLAGKS
jgi:hypothetical protein